jgi:CheY-like chemotaxis protein
MALILLVDDDEEIRRLWEAYLIPMGHEVLHANNGLEALHLAMAKRPELAILDLMMPVASGDLVLGFFRSTEALKKTAVLVVSAHYNVASLAAQYEADGYLQKPVSVLEFRDKVNELLQIART